LQELEHEALFKFKVLVIALGSVISTVMLVVQALPSDAITVYMLGHKLNTVAVLEPVKAPTGSQV
jgi:hypothetical protein